MLWQQAVFLVPSHGCDARSEQGSGSRDGRSGPCRELLWQPDVLDLRTEQLDRIAHPGV
jgi:hypothetical protein